MPLAQSQQTLPEGASPACEAGRKLGGVEMALVWQALHEDPQGPSRVLRDKVAQRPAPLQRSVRHRNRWRVTWPLSRRKGRPRRAASGPPRPSGTAVVRVTPRLSCVGVPLCAPGLEPQGALGPGVPHLQPAIQTSQDAHPEEACALGHHPQQTLRRRLQALFFAPRCGSKTLTGCAPHEHPLPTLVGRGYHRATLLQGLGQLERVAAAPALLPTLVPGHPGPLTSVAGPRMASWSRWSRPKGPSTLLGHSAVIAHAAAGDAVFVPSSPPDLPLSPRRVAYCQKVAVATGNVRCVIDRAVHAGALAQACDTQGLGWLCRREDHEPAGRASCTATEVATLQDGVTVSRGPWHVPRPEAPRPCVSVAPPVGKPLVDWGTPTVKEPVEPIEWPRGYRARQERQEHRVKRMRTPGALPTHYGRKKIVGPARHQHRAREQLAQSLEAAQKRVDKQVEERKAPQDKVAESTATGHSTRLAQRQRSAF